MKFLKIIIGTSAIAAVMALNLRHAANNYGIVTNSALHIEVLAQANTTGTGTGSGSGTGTGVDSCPGGSCNFAKGDMSCSACCPILSSPSCNESGCGCQMQ